MVSRSYPPHSNKLSKIESMSMASSRPNNGGERQPVFSSHFAPPPSFLPPQRAVMPFPFPAGAASASMPAMAPAPAAVRIMPVTASNLDAAMELMASLLPRFPFVAVDTEYPGVVHHHPATAGARITADERYAVAKANVDELPIVQLGVTLCDAQGRLPVFHDPHTGCPVEVSWEINFADFDTSVHRHTPESIQFLRSQGVDFDMARAHGVASAAFGHKLVSMLSSPSSNPNKLTWAMFGGMYDLGYLLKILTGGQPLPERKEMFVDEVRALLGGGRVFDAKYMAERCGRGDLRGVGLKRVARSLGVPRHYPEPPSLAGPKSILACRIFTVLRRFVFSLDGGASLEGCIDGMQ